MAADRRRNLGIPSGVIFPFAGTTAPYGYLIGDGRPVAIAEYPTLFAAIGYGHGNGTTNSDGTPSGFTSATHFNLPDPRGRFMRGVDGLAGVDLDKASRTAPRAGGNAGNTVGSVQGHTNESHSHHMFNAATGTPTDNAGENYIAKNPNGNVNYFSYTMTSLSSNVPAHGLTESLGGSETRPKNLNVNYIIKV